MFLNSLKNKLRATLVLPFLLAASLATAQTDSETGITWIPKVSTPPTIDGEIDQIWHASTTFPIANLNRGTSDNAADYSAVWYGLWDDTYFYFLIDITDEFLEDQAGSDTWRNDIIEVYFNMDNVKDGMGANKGDNYQYAFHWNKSDQNLVSNGSYEGVEKTQVTTANGWRIEVKIPWTTLTTEFVAEQNWVFGFDIAINDNDGNSVYDAVHYWWNSTSSALWSNMDLAGELALGEAFDGNYIPVIDELETQIAFEGQSSTINLSASDANATDTLTFDTVDLPSFAQLQDNGDGTASITVDALTGDANIYIFDVSVTDGAKTETIEVTLIVKDPNATTQPPVLDQIGEIIVEQGNVRHVTVNVTDIDSLSVEIEGTTLPDFAEFTDNENKTASLSFSPPVDAVIQSYSVTISASDDDTNTDSITFDVTVIAPSVLTTFYCDPATGDLNNTGTAQEPWPSLEEVIEAGRIFAAGDTIYLRTGFHGGPRITALNDGVVYIMPEEGHTPAFSSLTFSSTSGYWHASGLDISKIHDTSVYNSALVGISGIYNTVSDCMIYSELDSSAWSQQDWLSKVRSAVTMGNSNNLLEDCTILNVAMGVTVGGSFNTVRGNDIQYFRVDGIRGLGDDLLFENNYIANNVNVDDNHDDGFQSFTSGGNPWYRVTLRGNTIVQTTDNSRPFQGSLQGIGCFDGMYHDWVIENNSIVVNQWNGIALYGAVGCKIINNTVLDQRLDAAPGPTWITITAHKDWNFGTDPELDDYLHGRDNIVRNNLTTRISIGINYGEVDNNIEIGAADLDNYFVDYPFDLRLKAGSPAIDAGILTEAPTHDLTGIARPLDGTGDGSAAIDVGAYEYAGEGFGSASFWKVVETNGEWLRSAWFSWINTSLDPWIYHGYHGWIYLSDAGSGTFWYYASDVGWLWTKEGVYPFVYSAEDGWLYYLDGTTNPRYFFNTGTELWMEK